MMNCMATHRLEGILDVSFCMPKTDVAMERPGQAFLSYILDTDYAKFTEQAKRRVRETLLAITIKRGERYVAPHMNTLISFRAKR